MKLASPRRAAWTLGDQALSTVSNFGVTLFAARVSSPSGFGAFALAFAVYGLLLSIGQGIASEPLVIRYTARLSSDPRAGVASATGTSLTFGCATSILVALLGLSVPGPIGHALVALAMCLPALILQDCWRFAFFAQGSPRSAAVNDACWIVGQLLAFVWLLRHGSTASVEEVTLAWGGGAWLAAAVGALQAGVLPRPTASLRWVTEHRDLVGALVVDRIMMSSGTQLTFIAVAAVASLGAVGGLRGAQVLFGPFAVVLTAVMTFAVPEGIRISQKSYPAAVVAFRRLTVGLIVVSAVLTFLICLTPDSLGKVLLGPVWSLSRPLLPLFGVLTIARACTVPAFVALRVLDAPKAMLSARMVFSPLLLVCGIGGAVLDGAAGAVAGLAIGQTVGVYIWWRKVVSAHRLRAGEPALYVV